MAARNNNSSTGGSSSSNTLVLAPLAEDADENAFAAPCAGCGGMLPLPDGDVDYSTIRCKKCGKGLAMCM
jgi:hypothetical protein